MTADMPVSFPFHTEAGSTAHWIVKSSFIFLSRIPGMLNLAGLS